MANIGELYPSPRFFERDKPPRIPGQFGLLIKWPEFQVWNASANLGKWYTSFVKTYTPGRSYKS